MKEEWLFEGAVVPVDVETMVALVAEIHRLIHVVGGMALAQPTPAEYAMGYAEGFEDGCKPKPEQEPVAYINVEQHKLEWANKYMSWHTPTVVNLPKIPLYTTPPQRTWVGLTNQDRLEISDKLGLMDVAWVDLMEAIEAKLKEKNV